MTNLKLENLRSDTRALHTRQHAYTPLLMQTGKGEEKKGKG